MNKQRLLIAAEIFPPDIGGPATYVPKLAQAAVQAGWQVTVVCYADQAGFSKENGYQVFKIKRQESKLWQYLAYFWRLWQQSWSADLLFAQGPVASGGPAILVGWLLFKPVVVKVVGDYAWEQARHLGLTEKNLEDFQQQKLTGKIFWLRLIERQVARRAGAVLTPSVYLKNLVQTWGVTAEKITVIYNAAPANRPHNFPTTPLLVSGGRLVPWKGFAVLLKSFSEILPIYPAARLLIFGQGPQAEFLQKTINDLKINQQVKIEAAESSMIMASLQRASLFVLNSEYEGCSHAILEAQAAGCPVAVSRAGGNPELVKHQETGWLFDYNQTADIVVALKTLLADQALAARLAKNAQQQLSSLTAEKVLQETLNWLKSQA